VPSNCSAADPTCISPPVGRRSRPFQRGATERQAWNERIYLAAIIRLRLRRAEVYGLWSMVYGLFSLRPLPEFAGPDLPRCGISPLRIA